jgi:drug/metabolite transporter (DMT)-like permease
MSDLPAPGSGRAPLDPQTLGVLLVLSAALLWSSSGLFVKVLRMPPLELTGVRSALAFLALAPLLRLRAVRLDANLALLVLAFGGTQLAFVTATRWTTAANAIALQSTAPVWVFLAGSLVARRIHLPLLVPIALILAGIATILAEPAQGISFHGNMVGVVAGATFALTQLAFSRIRQPAVGAVALANLGSALGCLALLGGTVHLERIAGWEWLILVYLGTIQIGLAFILFTAGVGRITVAQASILTLLEPLLNPIWVYLALGEHPSPYGFAGFGLIFGGIVADFWLRLRLPRSPRGGRRGS